ncbi:MAG: peptidoglycan DD-metalloendopeptidase family protein [Steroidobacteraceae bacterium]
MNSTGHPSSMPRSLRSLGTLVCSLLVCGIAAGAAYRYRDPSGQWVYTDRPASTGQALQSVALGGGGAPLGMVVEPRSTDAGVALVAINPCQCNVEFAVKARTRDGEKLGRGTVPPQSERILLDVAAVDGPAEIRFEYGYVVGEPGAQHRPAHPYRAPFALTQGFQVTQAPPDAVTHVDPSSRNAIDIAMPVGTAIHAARDGLVINVAARHFRTGLRLQDMDEANFVQILHDDGTYAIYAHLQLDTVRVKIGQRVARGECIANSGNTGFSSGPHLHFVVLHNAGLRSESVPVAFAGPGGASVAPRSGQLLTAY